MGGQRAVAMSLGCLACSLWHTQWPPFWQSTWAALVVYQNGNWLYV